MSGRIFMATLSWYVHSRSACSVSVANNFTVWWYNYVPRYLRPYAEGNHCSRPIIHEGQDPRSSRAKVLRLDWWFHLGFSFHLPADVDLQAGIRREWSFYCPPQMFLRYDVLNI